MAVLSAEQFSQDVSAAKRAAADGPVIITNRGRPSHVLRTGVAVVNPWESGKRSKGSGREWRR